MKYLFTLLIFLPNISWAQGMLPWQVHGSNGVLHEDVSFVADPSNLESAWYSVRAGGVYYTNNLGRSERKLSHLGLGSLTIKDLAVAQNKPNTLVVITGMDGDVRINGTGVYRSDNKGQTWTMLPLQLEEDDLFVPEDVLIGPEGNVIFIATRFRIMRSGDGGQSWSSVYRIPPQDSGQAWSNTRFDAHPENLDHVAITLVKDKKEFGSQIHLTNDGGETWRRLVLKGAGEGVAHFQQILFAPSEPGVVWLRDGARSGGKIVFNRSEDYGRSFEQVRLDDRVGRNFYEIAPMHVHPGNADQIILWGRGVATYANGLLALPSYSGLSRHVRHIVPAPRTRAGFRTIYQDIRGGRVRLESRTAVGGFVVSEVVASEGGRFLHSCFFGAGTGGYHAYNVDQGFLYKKNRGVDLSDPWSPEFLQKTLEGVEMACLNGSRPIARVGGEMFQRTSDTHRDPSGTSWNWMKISNEDSVYSITSPEGGSTTVYASTPNGVFKSVNGGVRWTMQSTKMPRSIYAASEDVVYSPDKVSKDGGMSWDATPMVSEGRLKAHPTDPSEIWECGAQEVVRFRSFWTERESITTHMETGRCRDLLIFPQNPDVVWMGTDRGIWESKDAGETWVMKDGGIGPVSVMSVELSQNQKTIALSTWGRGIWTVEVNDILKSPTFIEGEVQSVPEMFTLHGNYPNPFNPSTVISFSAKTQSYVQVEIYDLMGRKVDIVVDRVMRSGDHQVRWDASSHASGIYFARMMADGEQVGIHKLTLAK